MRAKVAEVLGIRETAVELAYTFSFIKAAGDIRSLTSEEDWKDLVSEASQHRKKPQVKAAGTMDTWSVQLREIRELMDSGNGKVSYWIYLS